jgi:iron-regulated transporter 1
MRAVALVLLASVLLASYTAVAEAYDDYSYDDYYSDSEYKELDDANYYGDDDAEYYEEYGHYADDYDDYYDYADDEIGPAVKECSVGKDKKVKLSTGIAPCDLRVAGVDAVAKSNLPGGVDGVYKLVGCHDGRAMYKRDKSPAQQDRMLYYSETFGDWDISNGSAPNDDDVLMYGGESQHSVLPLYVPKWHIGTDLLGRGSDKEEYVPINASVKCTDGKVPAAPKQNAALARQGPALTDDEIEAKYRFIYDKYGHRPEPNPTVNLTFVFLLVICGLGVVLAFPYLLAGRKQKAGYQPVATSFAQVIQQSRKKQSGHAS